jgi:hypothetical protein
MKYISYYVVFACLIIGRSSLAEAAPDGSETYTLASQRNVGSLDHVNIQLDARGDLLTKSGTDEKIDRQQVSLSCLRDYDEKTLQLPDTAEKSLRSVRFYHESSGSLTKADAVISPKIRPENRIVGVEIAGQKSTIFSPKGPLNLDELELVSTLGDSLCLDQLLPAGPVKIGATWRISDDVVALLLGLEEITSNSTQMAFTEATAEYARFELLGKVEGKLYGASSQIDLAAKCRFNRHAGRIDWFAMKLTQKREIGVVEDGLDWTVVVKIKIDRRDASQELSDAALAGLKLKPTDESTLVQYLSRSGGYELTHDRSWYLIDRTHDYDEFHRLDRGQDIGLCKISVQSQVSVAKLPNLEQFQGVVRKLLAEKFGEFLETSQAETPAHLRILRLKVKGKEGETAVRWHYYLVSDPEGRQAVAAFRVEEKRLEQFGQADEQLVHSLRFVERVEKK